MSSDSIQVTIDDLAHDGRGVGKHNGKAVFIAKALPGEIITFKPLKKRRSYDEGELLAIITPSPDRVEPKCQHFGVCGACVFQHLSYQAQLAFKAKQVMETINRIGKINVSEHNIHQLSGEPWRYRRKARLSVKHVAKKEKVLVGFREKNGRFVADLTECHVLLSAVGEHLTDLSELIHSLSCYQVTPQIEVAAGDNAVALIIRHLEPLTTDDENKLTHFAQQFNFHVYLQPSGLKSIYSLYPKSSELYYTIPNHQLKLFFHPVQFIQINAEINLKLIDLALEWLELDKQDTVLDLFCGLGNFSLPMAKYAKKVIGVEGEQGLVKSATSNAVANCLENVEFFVSDLITLGSEPAWLSQDYNKVLLDPPRSGAQEIISKLMEHKKKPEVIIYVSCNPATLARDLDRLVNGYGYQLDNLGVADMFPHTHHIESIAKLSLSN